MRRRLLLCTIVLSAIVQSGASAPPRVSFIRPPRIVSDQETWTLYIRVERSPENRRLEVAAVDGDGVVSQTHRDVQGDQSPALWNVTWRLPAMDGIVIAAIYGVSGKEVSRAMTPLCVRDQFGPLCPSLTGEP